MRFKPITQEAKNTARLTLAADMGPLAHTTYKNTSTAREIMMQALDGNHSPQNRVAAKDALTRAHIIIIIIINRRSGVTSHTSHGHKTGTRSMQPVRSVPLGGPVVS